MLIVKIKTCIAQKVLSGLVRLSFVSNMRFAYFYYWKHVKKFTRAKILRVHLRDAKNKNKNFDARLAKITSKENSS